MAALEGISIFQLLLYCTAVPILTRMSLPGCEARFLGVGVTLASLGTVHGWQCNS